MGSTYIQPIAPLWDTFPTLQPKEREQGSDLIFADVFKYAIDSVRESENEVAELEYLLATGQLDNPAELTIASAKAGTAVDLLIQLRNRALDAYNELMRISV